MAYQLLLDLLFAKSTKIYFSFQQMQQQVVVDMTVLYNCLNIAINSKSPEFVILVQEF